MLTRDRDRGLSSHNDIVGERLEQVALRLRYLLHHLRLFVMDTSHAKLERPVAAAAAPANTYEQPIIWSITKTCSEKLAKYSLSTEHQVQSQ